MLYLYNQMEVYYVHLAKRQCSNSPKYCLKEGYNVQFLLKLY